MTSPAAPQRSPRPALAVLAGVLGLIGAAVCAVLAFFLLAGGGLTADGGTGGLWIVGLGAAAVAQAWGAVRLLRRRGWLFLALASVPGLLPLALLVVLWLEYRQDPTFLEVLGSVPVLTLALTLTRPVRRWAAPRPGGRHTSSGSVVGTGAGAATSGP